jgi:dienelactone hydrolase
MLVAPVANLSLSSRAVARPAREAIASEDGLSVPVQVLPRTCVLADNAPGPAVVWVHGGPNEDVSPRWYQELQVLALHGATVIAVNYRGSTGNGAEFAALADDLDGQAADVRAALRYARTRADVDPDAIFVAGISAGAPLVYRALAKLEFVPAGVVDWTGAGAALTRTDFALPPMLWVSGESDPITPTRRLTRRTLERRGLTIHHVEYAGGHILRDGAERARVLREVAAFVESAGAYGCDLAVP